MKPEMFLVRVLDGETVVYESQPRTERDAEKVAAGRRDRHDPRFTVEVVPEPRWPGARGRGWGVGGDGRNRYERDSLSRQGVHRPPPSRR